MMWVLLVFVIGLIIGRVSTTLPFTGDWKKASTSIKNVTDQRNESSSVMALVSTDHDFTRGEEDNSTLQLLDDEKIRKAKDRPSMGSIKIYQNGSLSIIKAPTPNTVFIHGEGVLSNLKERLASAVKEYGKFKRDTYFDFDSVDTPGFSVFESNRSPFIWSKCTCQFMSKYVCCFNGLSLIGIATNPCCVCSSPLPIHNNQRQSVLNEMINQTDPYTYSEKIDRAVWHGSATGHWEYAAVYSREFNLSLPYLNRQHPRKRIVSFHSSTKNSNLLDSSFNKEPWNNILKYKYIISVSGNSYAGLLKPALLSNSCVLRQDSLAQEWYESKLEQWVHFVPVKYDLSDLFEKIRWAKEHDNECEQIARRGREFALWYFSESEVNLYVHTVVNKGGGVFSNHNLTREEEDAGNSTIQQPKVKNAKMERSPIVGTNSTQNDVLKCSALCLRCRGNMPSVPSASVVNGNIFQKSSTYYSGNWGNVLSPYWAARTIAEFGGYVYKGRKFGPNTWMEYLPTWAPARHPQRERFENICKHCPHYEFFHKGQCSEGWGYMADAIGEDTRNAILMHSKRAAQRENDEIFNFFQPTDWLIYNRCCVFGHGAHAPGVLRTYDSIPSEGSFRVFIMKGRKEDKFDLCGEIINMSLEYIKKRNPHTNITILEASTPYVDFSRLVFAPNVLVAAVGSSWTMWSAILANNNTVVSHIPSFDTIMPLPLERVQILADIPVLTGPPNLEKYGIANGTFSNTTEDRRKVLDYFRSS